MFRRPCQAASGGLIASLWEPELCSASMGELSYTYTGGAGVFDLISVRLYDVE